MAKVSLKNISKRFKSVAAVSNLIARNRRR